MNKNEGGVMYDISATVTGSPSSLSSSSSS